MRPGPGFIALITIIVSALLTVFLLVVTASISYPLAPESMAAELQSDAQGNPLPQGSTSTAQMGSQPAFSQGADQSSTPSGSSPNEACAVSDRFPQKILQWCGLITRYADKHNLPPDLVAALIWIESGGNPTAYSRSGAVGLMQVMPSDGLAASFNCPSGPCFSNRPSTEQLKQPEFNVSYGTKMLGGLLARYGDLREALKSYGPADMGYGYADMVLSLFQRYGKQSQ